MAVLLSSKTTTLSGANGQRGRGTRRRVVVRGKRRSWRRQWKMPTLPRTHLSREPSLLAQRPPRSVPSRLQRSSDSSSAWISLMQPAPPAAAGEARRRVGAERRAPSAGFTARLSRAVRAAWKWRTAARSEHPAFQKLPRPPSLPAALPPSLQGLFACSEYGHSRSISNFLGSWE